MSPTAHPPADRARAPLPSLVLIFAAWLVPALLSGFDAYMQSRLEGHPPDWHWVFFNSLDWLLYAVLTPFVFRAGRRLPLQPPHLARNIALHFAGALGMCVAWAGLGTLLRLAEHKHEVHIAYQVSGSGTVKDEVLQRYLDFQQHVNGTKAECDAGNVASLKAAICRAEARAAAHRAVRLDTLPVLERAIALYRALGFHEIPPYGNNPPEAICFELAL